LENLQEWRILELLLRNLAGGVEALEDLGGDGDVRRGPELTEKSGVFWRRSLRESLTVCL
jgi:hypothetical protein